MGLKVTSKGSVVTAITLLAGIYVSAANALISEAGYHSSVEANDKRAPTTSTLTSTAQIQTSSMLDRVIHFESEKLASQREHFLEAEEALRNRHLTKFRRLLPTLTDYPLYPYLRYQEIERRLGNIQTKELKAFFDEYETQAVARMLRSKLLRHYARKGQWQRFLTFYAPQKSARLQCYYAYALIRTGNAEVAYPLIEQLWQTGKSQPSNCDRVFNHWKAAGELTPELAWKRLELALDNGRRRLAQYVVRSLPPSDRKLAKSWIKLHRDPARLSHYQSMLISSAHVMAPDVLADTAKRLAKKDPQLAAENFTQTDLLDRLPVKEKYELIETLAMSLSLKHLPGAEEWFSRIPKQNLSDLGQEWRIRVALRESRWQTAFDVINGLPQNHQESDRWQYWRARVMEELGKVTDAKTHFTRLAKNRSYYGFLAADRIGLPYALKDRPHEPDAAEMFTIVQQPGIRRARELFHLDRQVQARREWYQATHSMTNDERINASKLAQFWGWTGQSIITMARTDSRDDIGLRFPLQLQDKVITHSQNADIDPAWTFGVIRRESAFMRDARSSKGAVGLMQLMPATAKRMSRSIKKVKYRDSSQLFHPDTNLALGTHYLNKMLERFNGQTVLATAAYNAGENRVDRWLPKEDELDAERWIENIPYKETREYVANVLAYTVIYADRMGLTGQRLSERMATVIPKDSMLANNKKDKEQLAALKDDTTEIR